MLRISYKVQQILLFSDNTKQTFISNQFLTQHLKQMEMLKQLYQFNKIKYCIMGIIDSKQTDFINIKTLNELTSRIVSQQHHNLDSVIIIIKEIIFSNIFNSFKILKLLLILHSCIQKLKSLKDVQKFQENVQQISDKLIQVQRIASRNVIGYDQKQTKIDSYYRKNILLPFCWNMLKKIEFLKQDRFKQNQQEKTIFKSRFSQKISALDSNFEQKLHYKAINNIKAITATQIQFYQIGRYYSTHKLINNLFIQYLKDLSQYLAFLRQKCQAYANQIFQVSTNKLHWNHLLIVQSQKILNSIFSFYYNKYLFSNIQKYVKLQISLKLPQNYYQLQTTMNKQKSVQQSYIKTLTRRSASSQKLSFLHKKDKINFKKSKCKLDSNTDIQTQSSQNQCEISKTNQFQYIFDQITSLHL